ncbi:MGDG synthase family glycosyltransferase [Clostridium sp.]|uniref:MGDG synthase family glycosyltransferase n=1 Tax=Clostridium sp. TaxID=1506 RepID=UPI003F2C2735
MNILILSASTGGGHMAASKAIEHYINKENKNINIEIIDTLKYISPILNKTIDNGYVYLATKTPSLYKRLYTITNNDNSRVDFVGRLNKLFSKSLLNLISDFNPDLIITTHPFPTEMTSILKEKEEIKIPLICIMTDYAPHKTWINNKVDAYIVSNEDMMNEMITRGVNKDLIHPYGIPIEGVFYEKIDKNVFLDKIELDPILPTILIMAGSFGVTNILQIYKEINKVTLDFQVIIITGKNKNLYNEFKEILPDSSKRTKLIYFTNEVNKYMQASDLLVTKPGGLTISEAIACNIPMVLFNAIPGQEVENAEFLLNHNMAIMLEDTHNCSYVFQDLLLDKGKLNNMKLACENFDKTDSLEKIYNLIKEFLNI